MDDAGMSRRRDWLSVLAGARPEELEAAIQKLDEIPECVVLRQPEVGLVMARGRAGGVGQRFNLGEIPVTRCAVQSPKGQIGHGYVQGRDKHHAKLAATMDALLQDQDHQTFLLAEVVDPLAKIADERRATIRRKAEATRVEFFTMVRGEG